MGVSCTLQIVSVIESACIPTQNDTFPNGYFLYDVEVAYSGGIPTTGSLILNGGEGASVPVGSLSGGSHTFTDLRGTSGNMPFNVTAFFSDNSGCLSMSTVDPPAVCSIPEGSCEDLFISEYLEGSTGNNKCVEIYNPTAVSVDLAAGAYKILLFANGATVPGSTINLIGTIPPYGTFLLCNSGSVQGILDLADSTSGSLTHNGDDALALVKGALNDTLDIFGVIGSDPGTNWKIGTDSTSNSILRRRFEVTQGIATNPGGTGVTAFTTLDAEWDSYSDLDYSNFGTHASSCTPPIPECPITSVLVRPFMYNEACGESNPEISCYSCNDNETPDPSDDFFTLIVEVQYNDLPNSGYLIITVNGVDVDSIPVGELLFPEGTELVEFGPYTLPANGMVFTADARFDEIILCSLSSSDSAPGPCSALPPCEELFFSEYIEGSGNNKCLEIFNPADAPVDLAANNYQIKMYFNGSGAPGTTVNLTGAIAANGTYVVCSSSAAIEFRNLADQLNGQSWFNGDDAVALSKGGINIDIIGQIGTDPGTSWSGGSGVSTVDETIRRKPYITAGDPNGSDTFDPGIEWDSFPVNESFGLRFHRSDCNFNPDGLVQTEVGSGCNGDVQSIENGYTLASSCWGDMIGREATFFTTDICGDFDFSAKVTVTPFGFAGLMFRETLAPDTRYVYQFVRGNNQASWAVRSNPALPVQVQSVPQINRQYLRMQRVGNLFRGYLSVNGIVWNQVHQSGLNIDECGYVGFATHSGSDGVEVSSTYTNINASFTGSPARPEFTDNSDNDLLMKSLDFKVYPNPANQYLDIELSGSEWTEREISIMDINGRLAFYQKSETSNIVKIDLQSVGLMDGVYIIQIKDAEGFYQTRFVKASN
ncbi:MAG: lamin tail domain-containing protein [Saprospiraceae bacterium]|nr:lamin tail domain-containing protein [Saprospiraceae bacterium]